MGSNFEVKSVGKIVSTKPVYLGFKAVKRAQGSTGRPGGPEREIRLEQVPLGIVRRYRQQSDAKRAGKR